MKISDEEKKKLIENNKEAIEKAQKRYLDAIFKKASGNMKGIFGKDKAK